MTFPPFILVGAGLAFSVVLTLYLVARHKTAQLTLALAKTKEETEKGLKAAQALIDQERRALKAEELRVKEHYENEAKKVQVRADAVLLSAARDLEALKKYSTLQDAERSTKQLLADAMREANALRVDAQALLAQAKITAQGERAELTRKANEIKLQADQILDRATRNAAKIVDDAHKNAEQIAGDAYTALRDKDALEHAAKAIRNIIDGYGDRYVVPTHSLIDELASGYGHTEAGKMLQDAREQSKRMVEEGLAAACDYKETNRKESAIRFVIDAFNGRVGHRRDRPGVTT